ncbi:MAG: transcriptional repressor [Acidimicrobiia bacterium]|nr:transcriptional repressor [Acidimicrobiia bacterium]
MKSPDELTDIFRARGLKVTPQRQLIFRVLHDELRHATAEAVHARASRDMPTMSLRTVYQTLNDLAAMGEIVQLDLGTGSSRFDTNLDAHQHLVCAECGSVRDIVVDSADIELAEATLEGFAVSSTDIVFRGRCASCAAGARSDVPSTPPLSEETATHA